VQIWQSALLHGKRQLVSNADEAAPRQRERERACAGQVCVYNNAIRTQQTRELLADRISQKQKPGAICDVSCRSVAQPTLQLDASETERETQREYASSFSHFDLVISQLGGNEHLIAMQLS